MRPEACPIVDDERPVGGGLLEAGLWSRFIRPPNSVFSVALASHGSRNPPTAIVAPSASCADQALAHVDCSRETDRKTIPRIGDWHVD